MTDQQRLAGKERKPSLGQWHTNAPLVFADAAVDWVRRVVVEQGQAIVQQIACPLYGPRMHQYAQPVSNAS
jgi:hypothetical protein